MTGLEPLGDGSGRMVGARIDRPIMILPSPVLEDWADEGKYGLSDALLTKLHWWCFPNYCPVSCLGKKQLAPSDSAEACFDHQHVRVFRVTVR